MEGNENDVTINRPGADFVQRFRGCPRKCGEKVHREEGRKGGREEGETEEGRGKREGRPVDAPAVAVQGAA